MTIIIEQLEFETILGILEHERLTPQRVRIDCTIDYRYDAEGYLDYAEASTLIQETMHHHRFGLIEEALFELASALKNRFSSIEALVLTIRKPDILSNCSVGVRKTFHY